jgi:hypothetical protein
MDENTINDFMRMVNITGECWLWTGTHDKNGYGHYHKGNTQGTSHRLMYIYCYGMPEYGLHICHKPVICHNRSCCNPTHLEAKPPKENHNDKILDGTHGKKLTESEVVSIKCRFHEKSITLAEEFSVTQSLIRMIRRGDIWKHIT